MFTALSPVHVHFANCTCRLRLVHKCHVLCFSDRTLSRCGVLLIGMCSNVGLKRERQKTPVFHFKQRNCYATYNGSMAWNMHVSTASGSYRQAWLKTLFRDVVFIDTPLIYWRGISDKLQMFGMFVTQDVHVWDYVNRIIISGVSNCRQIDFKMRAWQHGTFLVSVA